MPGTRRHAWSGALGIGGRGRRTSHGTTAIIGAMRGALKVARSVRPGLPPLHLREAAMVQQHESLRESRLVALEARWRRHLQGRAARAAQDDRDAAAVRRGVEAGDRPTGRDGAGRRLGRGDPVAGERRPGGGEELVRPQPGERWAPRGRSPGSAEPVCPPVERARRVRGGRRSRACCPPARTRSRRAAGCRRPGRAADPTRRSRRAPRRRLRPSRRRAPWSPTARRA